MGIIVQRPLSTTQQYAFSGGPNLYRLMAPTNQVDLMNRLVAALLAAGWHYIGTVSTSNTGVADRPTPCTGYRLEAVTPQSFSVFVDIYVPISGGWIWWTPVFIQFRSSSGSGAAGIVHWVNYVDGGQYQIVAGPCGFFSSRPGMDSVPDGASVCGGVPYMDSGCGFGTDPVSECWWSMGDSGTGAPWNTDHLPRVSIGYTGGAFSHCGCYNGTMNYGSHDQAGTVQVLRISSGDMDQEGGRNSHPVWVDGLPILYPAFVAWGDTSVSAPKIRGQIYDAMCRSRAYPEDITATWDGSDWMNYTDNHFFGSLWLVTGKASSSISAVNVGY